MKRFCIPVLVIASVLAVNFRAIPDVISTSAALEREKTTIVIDPGHGGEDGGTMGKSGILEKDINLDIALILTKMFADAGYEVILTRDGDYSIGDPQLETVARRKASDIRKRTNICNSSGAVLAISIHQNYFEQSKYYGAQVFYGVSEGSENLAEILQKRLREDIQPENDRKAKPGGESIYLLKNTTVPAVIVECGFLSNSDEEMKLSDLRYQRKIAYSIFLGAEEYLQKG